MTPIDDDTTSHGGGDINSSRSPRERAIDAFGGARENVSGALNEAPLLALAGGIAAGAVLAALLPRTRTETRAVRPYANRAKDSARAAFKAAKDTGGEKLNEVGISRDKGEETLRSLLQGVGEAARASADAAVAAVRDKG
ncbi:MAG: hypothetical protein V4513_10540 [Pseudomonadota bacterium]